VNHFYNCYFSVTWFDGGGLLVLEQVTLVSASCGEVWCYVKAVMVNLGILAITPLVAPQPAARDCNFIRLNDCLGRF
jgi:hypothetical protein